VIIGHLTDTHIDGSADRSRRLARALGETLSRNAQYLLLTGDLTAHGHPDEVRELARLLAGFPIGATIVGGNHDGDNFQYLADQYLRRFSGSVPVTVGDVKIVPVHTYFARRAFAFRALGSIGRDQFAALEHVVSTTHGPVVVAMHHGPQIDPLKAFAGLVDRHRIEGLLRSNPRVSVCCGHDHRVIDIGQVHVAASCATHPDPLRIYDVGVGRFESVYRSACEGSYFGDAVCPVGTG
jgi:Icc protein